LPKAKYRINKAIQRARIRPNKRTFEEYLKSKLVIEISGLWAFIEQFLSNWLKGISKEAL
jgi:hypothetical protein